MFFDAAEVIKALDGLAKVEIIDDYGYGYGYGYGYDYGYGDTSFG